jgi:glycosyltransferase involved in cell wall biosynthesis
VKSVDSEKSQKPINNNSMPKVSIVLTSFDHGEYIQEAIQCALDQTFDDFELIILDDCSSDNSWEIINQYTDPRIKAFRSQRRGEVVYELNRAIATLASGEYVAIHHSDDVWKLNKLETQVAFLDEHADIGAVFTWVQFIDEKGDELTNDWFNQEAKTQWELLGQLFGEKNHLNHPSVLIRSQCYRAVGTFRYGLLQTGDAELWSRVLIKFPVHVIKEKLTKHRRFSDQSNTSGGRTDVVIRMSNEWNVLRENFLSIINFDDIVATFPGLERFRRKEAFDNKFLLAMACLYECKQRNAWQLGLKWLFELLNDPLRSRKIAELYSFSSADFYSLTAEFDVYDLNSIGGLKVQVGNLNQTLSERGLQISNLEVAVAERDVQMSNLNHEVDVLDKELAALRCSFSWQVTRPLRFVYRLMNGSTGR